MPAHSRKDIIREGEVAVYHVWSRCVQRMWLCGVDPLTGVDYSHRKEWIEKLLEYQSKVFAVDVGSFHVLSNHKHGVLCTRPDIAAKWADEEVAWRWKMAWPEWKEGQWTLQVDDKSIEKLLNKGSQHLEQIRRNLSSLSWFMARWKEPIARLANDEAKTSGHMWAERFGSRELTDDGEILVGSIYTDLQQVKCGAADSLASSDHSSIQLRLRAWAAQQAADSVQAFQKKRVGGGDHQLPPEVVEELLVDSWLMPLSDESPLLLMREETQDDADDQPVVVLTSVDAVSEQCTEETAESPAEESEQPEAFEAADATTTEAKPQEPVAPEQPTYRVHKLQLPKLECRERRPLLEMSRETYLTIVQRTQEQWKAFDQRDALIDESLPPRASPTATPKSWKASVAQFGAFFDGIADKLPIPVLKQSRGDPA